MFVNGSDSDNDLTSASAWTPPVSTRTPTPTPVSAPASLGPRSIDWARSLRRMDSEVSSVGSEHGRMICGRGDAPVANTHPAPDPDGWLLTEEGFPDFDASATASSGSADKFDGQGAVGAIGAIGAVEPPKKHPGFAVPNTPLPSTPALIAPASAANTAVPMTPRPSTPALVAPVTAANTHPAAAAEPPKKHPGFAVPNTPSPSTPAVVAPSTAKNLEKPPAPEDLAEPAEDEPATDEPAPDEQVNSASGAEPAREVPAWRRELENRGALAAAPATPMGLQEAKSQVPDMDDYSVTARQKGDKFQWRMPQKRPASADADAADGADGAAGAPGARGDVPKKPKLAAKRPKIRKFAFKRPAAADEADGADAADGAHGADASDGADGAAGAPGAGGDDEPAETPPKKQRCAFKRPAGAAPPPVPATAGGDEILNEDGYSKDDETFSEHGCNPGRTDGADVAVGAGGAGGDVEPKKKHRRCRSLYTQGPLLHPPLPGRCPRAARKRVGSHCGSGWRPLDGRLQRA
jgi:hypothetical protein